MVRISKAKFVKHTLDIFKPSEEQVLPGFTTYDWLVLEKN